MKVDFRITPEESRFIKRLVSSGTYQNRSEVLRRSVEEFMAKYTGIPTLSSLDEQIKRLRYRCDGYEEDFRETHRRLKELEE